MNIGLYKVSIQLVGTVTISVPVKAYPILINRESPKRSVSMRTHEVALSRKLTIASERRPANSFPKAASTQAPLDLVNSVPSSLSA